MSRIYLWKFSLQNGIYFSSGLRVLDASNDKDVSLMTVIFQTQFVLPEWQLT